MSTRKAYQRAAGNRRFWRGSPAGRDLDSHGVKRPPHEDRRGDEEQRRQPARHLRALLGRQFHRQLHGKEAKQRRKLNDRIHGDRRRSSRRRRTAPPARATPASPARPSVSPPAPRQGGQTAS